MKQWIFIVCVLLIGLVSCKKDEATAPEPPVVIPTTLELLSKAQWKISIVEYQDDLYGWGPVATPDTLTNETIVFNKDLTYTRRGGITEVGHFVIELFAGAESHYITLYSNAGRSQRWYMATVSATTLTLLRDGVIKYKSSYRPSSTFNGERQTYLH